MSSSIKVIKEQNIIDLENIVVQFPSRDGSLFGRKKFTAVNNVSLGIKAGETIGLVGESGCGKSTLANVIIGLLKPTSGLVKFNGLQMQYGSSEARKQFGRQVSVIFQDPATALNPRMKVLDILRDPMDIHNVLQPHEREKRVYDLLSRVGLPRSAAQVEPTRLSGGQKQRVAIARALVTNPAIICMDEPLSNLDAKLRVQLRNELKKMQKDFGITTIYVTHDQEEALTLSDRIAVFNKGVIEQIGTPNEVYNHSATEFVCNFIGDINRLETPLVQHLNDRGAGLDTAKHNYIRLERLHVNVQPRDGELALDGVVESREYYGLYIKYYINVEGQTLKVIEKNDGVNIYEPDQKMSVVINPSHVMAYEASEEAAHE